MQQLAIIKKRFNELLAELDTQSIYHIYASGSVARNEYYEGWSDVDINVVARSPLTFDTLAILNKLCASLRQELNCKVGLDFIAYDDVLMCARPDVSKAYVARCLTFIKNNHEENIQLLMKGTLYISEGALPPVVSAEAFKDVPLDEYSSELERQVYETIMRRTDVPAGSIHEIRIVTKACLYLLQTHLLSKTGRLVTDYSLLPDEARKDFSFDVSILEMIYRKLKNNESSSLLAQYDTILRQLFVLFNEIRHNYS